MTGLLSAQLLVDGLPLGRGHLAAEHDVLRLTVDGPHYDSEAPAGIVVWVALARSPLATIAV